MMQPTAPFKRYDDETRYEVLDGRAGHAGGGPCRSAGEIAGGIGSRVN